ncbi:MAG: hypothetical protein ACI4LP_11670 [Anaerovoracaceae bacterium]
MKPIKHLIKKPAIFLIVLLLSTVMASGSGPESEISMLVTQRTDVMNEYFGGHILYKEAAERIEKIEKGRLLEEDLESMKSFFQTDIEEITDYKITKVEITEMDDTLICAVVTVVWKVFGNGGEEYIEGIYSVIAEKCEKSYKLVQFF